MLCFTSGPAALSMQTIDLKYVKNFGIHYLMSHLIMYMYKIMVAGRKHRIASATKRSVRGHGAKGTKFLSDMEEETRDVNKRMSSHSRRQHSSGLCDDDVTTVECQAPTDNGHTGIKLCANSKVLSQRGSNSSATTDGNDVICDRREECHTGGAGGTAAVAALARTPRPRRQQDGLYSVNDAKSCCRRRPAAVAGATDEACDGIMTARHCGLLTESSSSGSSVVVSCGPADVGDSNERHGPVNVDADDIRKSDTSARKKPFTRPRNENTALERGSAAPGAHTSAAAVIETSSTSASTSPGVNTTTECRGVQQKETLQFLDDIFFSH